MVLKGVARDTTRISDTETLAPLANGTYVHDNNRCYPMSQRHNTKGSQEWQLFAS